MAASTTSGGIQVATDPVWWLALIVEARQRYILGTHILGKYPVEDIEMVAASMAREMRSGRWRGCNWPTRPSRGPLGRRHASSLREQGMVPLMPTAGAI